MVIGLLILSAIPVVTGVAEGYSAQQTHKQRVEDARRMKRFNIAVYCDAQSARAKEIHGGRLVLLDGRVWIAPAPNITTNTNTNAGSAAEEATQGYLASAFYIEYPDPDRVPAPQGLVSQIADEPPMLNWLYLDKDTMEVRYGNRSASKAHYVGPWDWTEDEEGVVYEGEEQFMAVQEEGGKRWQVYFDPEDDGLKAYVPKGRRRLRISLERVLVEEKVEEKTAAAAGESSS